MKKTLYLRIILAYILFGLFGFFSVATIISRLTTEYCVRDKARLLYGEASRISDTYALQLYKSKVSLEEVQAQMEALSSYMDTEIWILNPSGRMVVNSKQAPDPEQETFVEDFDSTITAGNYYTTGTFFDSFENDVLSVIAPITSDFKIRGYVVIHLPMESIRTDANGMLNISYMLLVILIVLSLIILLFFTEYVYRPLRHIIAAAEQYALGNMHYPISIEREDELGYLSASLGYMAETIARAEDDQKKFIANVSHDFRSPLTSMRGFLEAMLDGTIPPDRYEHYLKVVLGETERLTKLTNGLLTLNNLNTGGILLQRTDFDINAVIRSVGASFEQTCRDRRIRIQLVLTGRILYVNADLEKIQQVLYNLVDNAIKFSRPDSEITIDTTEKGDTVFVSVRDNGIGIPKEDQSLIWDRFYKTDLSRGKDKKGTGLGLSIVREIIRAHNENINLVSTEGVGSTFTFTLRRSDINDSLSDMGELES
ncbi:MAG: HAMP domain-containing histidine kinase [Lachnospiraceae bacterium]|nr:HAMP domain-containing histidine kinase [Lachnospiraceae bacterium]